MNLEYTITETTHRNRLGQPIKIDFQFDESTMMTSAPTSSGITRQNKEKRSRSYEWSITREQYQSLIAKLRRPITFDEFVASLRPIIMGYYRNNELERAFTILDRDKSGTIDIKEFSAILPILNKSINANDLHEYIRQVDENFDGELDYNEFRALVLRGIGRNIICHLEGGWVWVGG
jgi:Ca2+-binding EF-hand superfamily protein